MKTVLPFLTLILSAVVVTREANAPVMLNELEPVDTTETLWRHEPFITTEEDCERADRNNKGQYEWSLSNHQCWFSK